MAELLYVHEPIRLANSAQAIVLFVLLTGCGTAPEAEPVRPVKSKEGTGDSQTTGGRERASTLAVAEHGSETTRDGSVGGSERDAGLERDGRVASPAASKTTGLRDASVDAQSLADGASSPGDGAVGDGDVAKARSVEPNWRNRSRGRQVFKRVCADCHPGGREGRGPRIIGKEWAPWRMRAQIRRGGGLMDPILPSELSRREMSQLFVFLRAIRAVRSDPR